MSREDADAKPARDRRPAAKRARKLGKQKKPAALVRQVPLAQQLRKQRTKNHGAKPRQQKTNGKDGDRRAFGGPVAARCLGRPCVWFHG